LDSSVEAEIESICDQITFKKSEFIQHSDMMALLPKSDLLLLSIGNSKNSSYALSTKVFEYMISGSKVLGIGPSQGAAAEVVAKTGIGKFFERDDTAGVNAYLITCFEAFNRNESAFTIRNESMEKYSFNKLSQQLDSTMKELIR
jgi:glycosyltransferase involved in cell wall biosynthesis